MEQRQASRAWQPPPCLLGATRRMGAPRDALRRDPPHGDTTRATKASARPAQQRAWHVTSEILQFRAVSKDDYKRKYHQEAARHLRLLLKDEHQEPLPIPSCCKILSAD